MNTLLLKPKKYCIIDTTCVNMLGLFSYALIKCRYPTEIPALDIRLSDQFFTAELLSLQ